MFIECPHCRCTFEPRAAPVDIATEGPGINSTEMKPDLDPLKRAGLATDHLTTILNDLKANLALAIINQEEAMKP